MFENCKDVTLKDVRLINSPNWCVDIRFCEWVWIDGITILNERKAPNTDGIDPVSSKNVFISNCYIDTGDDAICPKTRGDRPTENLVVTNCILISDDSAIKFGTRSDAPIRDAVFSNIIIKNTDYGIGFFAKDGGIFENIRFENIHIETTRDAPPDETKPMGTYPIFIDLERRSPSSKLGAIRDIHFSNITINTYEGHCLLLGQPERPLENIRFSNIAYTLQKRGAFEGNKKPRGVRSLVDKAPNDYSDVSAHFSFAHINGLSIEGLRVKDNDPNAQFERRMIWGYDVHNLSIEDFSNELKIVNQELPQVHLKSSSAIEISDSAPVHSASPFLYLEGETDKIVIFNNNFVNIRNLVAYDPTYQGGEIVQFNNVGHP